MHLVSSSEMWCLQKACHSCRLQAAEERMHALRSAAARTGRPLRAFWPGKPSLGRARSSSGPGWPWPCQGKASPRGGTGAGRDLAWPVFVKPEVMTLKLCTCFFRTESSLEARPSPFSVCVAQRENSLDKQEEEPSEGLRLRLPCLLLQ